MYLTVIYIRYRRLEPRWHRMYNKKTDTFVPAYHKEGSACILENLETWEL